MKQGLLIDGYNVIKALPGLRAREDISLEAGRDALTGMLAGYKTAHPGLEIVVVFDAAGAEESGTDQTRVSGINIIFDRVCADSRIKKIVEASKNPRGITVVSRDNGIINYVRSLGAASLSPAELLKRVKTPGKGKGTIADKPIPGSAEAVEIDKAFKKIWDIDKS